MITLIMLGSVNYLTRAHRSRPDVARNCISAPGIFVDYRRLSGAIMLTYLGYVLISA
jgi:hypothetical protein